MSIENYSEMNNLVKKADKKVKRQKATKAAILFIVGFLLVGYVVGQVMVGLLGLEGRGGLHVFLDTLMGTVMVIGVGGLFYAVREAFLAVIDD